MVLCKQYARDARTAIKTLSYFHELFRLICKIFMSNLTTSILLTTFSLLLVAGFYFLVKKWSKFHLSVIGKVFKVIYALILILMVILALNLSYETFNQYLENDRLRVFNEMDGFVLGWSKDEVYFRKGQPEAEHGDVLTYNGTYVDILQNKVAKIIHVCNEETSYEKWVAGISCGANVDSIVNKFGNPKFVSVSSDKLRKLYNYPQYNLSFLMSKSNVIAFGVYDLNFFDKGLEFKNESTPQSNKEADATTQQKQELPASKESVEEPAKENLVLPDHCEPNLKKSERLRRLALHGVVRETGYNTYSVGNFEIYFSGNEVISCR